MTDSGVVAASVSELDSALTRSAISLAPRYQKLFEGALLGIYV